MYIKKCTFLQLAINYYWELFFVVAKNPLVGGVDSGGDNIGGKGGFWKKKEEKKCFKPFLDASGYKNIGATIRIGREIWRPYYIDG